MGVLILAVLAAGALGALTDWLFMGVLFHDAYNRYPEVWREGVREGKNRAAILWATALGFVMTGAVFVLCNLAEVHRIRDGLLVAAATWLAGPAVVIVVSNMFVKIDPKITLAHCLGYGARIAIAGVAAGLLFGRLKALA